jgi:L,D-transpeptidase YcbB
MTPIRSYLSPVLLALGFVMGCGGEAPPPARDADGAGHGEAAMGGGAPDPGRGEDGEAPTPARAAPVAASPGVPASRPAASLAPVPPPPGDSAALRMALEGLLDAQARGGWGQLPAGATLHPGDRDPRVVPLRARLVRSGDLPPWSGASADSLLFDPVLEEAVRRFQARHALDVDGVVGAGTRNALNVPVEDRIRQVRLNLQDRSAFRPDPAPMRILVNIPAFQVWILEEGRDPEQHRVIVGRTDRPTPLVEGRVAHVVLAPYWNVPANILARDKLPILRRDQGYLDRQSMTVLARATGQPVDPSAIDWAHIGAPEFNSRYWLRQDPGPGNALGFVKFIFPNPHDVYLHDTPDRHLFERGRRSFSSGCIRLEGAMQLAERLLGPVPGWGVERTRQVAAGGVETWVPLPEPIPIHTVYWSAWVERDGTLHLADDLYGLDARRQLPVLEEGMSECAVD